MFELVQGEGGVMPLERAFVDCMAELAAEKDILLVLSLIHIFCLDKLTMHKKQELAITFAELVYDGQWYTPLREALSAFVDLSLIHI